MNYFTTFYSSMSKKNLWICLIKIDKKSWKILNQTFKNPDTTFFTASTIKIVFAGLFYEYCSSELSKTVKINNKDKFIGGILHWIEWEQEISYEILLNLMIVISDNTATNIIFDKLTATLWDLNTFIRKEFKLEKTTIFDLRTQKGLDYIYGSGESTTQEFWVLMRYFLFESKYANKVKDLLSKQYITGRWLRYIDNQTVINSWNKTWQLDDMINDCWFIETKNAIFLYTIFMKVLTKMNYEYSVENKYYKKIWKIVLDFFNANQ